MKYKAHLKLGARVYTSEGDTKVEAIHNLNVPPTAARSVSILTIEKGKEKGERILPAILTMRLFSISPSVRALHEKQVGMRFSL